MTKSGNILNNISYLGEQDARTHVNSIQYWIIQQISFCSGLKKNNNNNTKNVRQLIDRFHSQMSTEGFDTYTMIVKHSKGKGMGKGASKKIHAWHTGLNSDLGDVVHDAVTYSTYIGLYKPQPWVMEQEREDTMDR